MRRLLFVALLALAVPRVALATIVDGNADDVFGQKDFTSGAAPSSASSSNVRSPAAISSGGSPTKGFAAFVADTEHHRVLAMGGASAWSSTATAVIGQATMTESLPNAGGTPTEDTLNAPVGVAQLGLQYAIADTGNHRVVVGTCCGSPDLVFGQKTFYTAIRNSGGVSESSMSAPRGVALFGGSLYVADTDNHRVLAIAVGDSGGAYQCIGQSTCMDAAENGVTGKPSSNSFKLPRAIAIDRVRGELVIADTGNHRVLQRNLTATSFVYGQGGLFDRGLPSSGGVSAQSLNTPVSVAFDGVDGFWVVDQGHYRVLHFRRGVLAADRVLGQKDFTIGAGNPLPTASSFVLPTGVTVVDGDVYVADGGANRVLRFKFACSPGACDDGNPCTDDTCGPAGCSHVLREYSDTCRPYSCDLVNRVCRIDCSIRACASGYRCTAFKQCVKTCAAPGGCDAGTSCVDGLCCDRPCDGKCESCIQPGREGVCAAISGKPKRPCTFTNECGGQCNGFERRECTPLAADSPCGAESCAEGIEQRRGTCDGFGTCRRAERACAPFACGGGACNTLCRFDFDCEAPAHCEGGQCVPSYRASGEGCSHAGAVEATSVTLLLWAISATAAVLRGRARRQRT